METKQALILCGSVLLFTLIVSVTTTITHLNDNAVKVQELGAKHCK